MRILIYYIINHTDCFVFKKHFNTGHARKKNKKKKKKKKKNALCRISRILAASTSSTVVGWQRFFNVMFLPGLPFRTFYVTIFRREEKGREGERREEK